MSDLFCRPFHFAARTCTRAVVLLLLSVGFWFLRALSSYLRLRAASTAASPRTPQLRTSHFNVQYSVPGPARAYFGRDELTCACEPRIPWRSRLPPAAVHVARRPEAACRALAAACVQCVYVSRSLRPPLAATIVRHLELPRALFGRSSGLPKGAQRSSTEPRGF
jgi:hypothetical protein